MFGCKIRILEVDFKVWIVSIILSPQYPQLHIANDRISPTPLADTNENSKQ